MDASALPIDELLPHGPEMILLDGLVAHDSQRTVARVEVRTDSLFFERTGVPAWVGIEYMAQTMAAHVGFEARLRGEAPPIGFLLGTRLYESRIAEFPLGAMLKVSVAPEALELRFGSFKCSIEIDTVVASAVVNVYQPDADGIDRLRRGTAEP